MEKYFENVTDDMMEEFILSHGHRITVFLGLPWD
jgi:hypothetical protein